jgi:putative peptide zinc metalloprotease protein
MASGKPLLSPNWFRVAAVRPRLHDHVRITRHHFRGERWFVLEDLAENRVHRYAPAAQQAIALMDGQHTLDEIWQALASLGDERPTQDEMLHLMAQLDGASLLATASRCWTRTVSSMRRSGWCVRWLRSGGCCCGWPWSAGVRRRRVCTGRN